MAITFDTKKDTAESSANPVVNTYTCGANAKLLVVHLATDVNGTRTGGAPTYGVTPMTEVTTQVDFGEGTAEVWYLKDPTVSESLTVSIPNTGTNPVTVMISSYDAASGYSITFDKFAQDQQISANPSVSVTPANADSLIVDAMFSGDGTTPSDNSDVLIYQHDTGQEGNGAQYKLNAPASSNTLTWTIPSDDWNMVVAVFYETELIADRNINITIEVGYTTESVTAENSQLGDIDIDGEWGYTSEDITAENLQLGDIDVYSGGFTTEDITVEVSALPDRNIDVFSSGFTTEAVTVLLPIYNVDVFSEGFTTEAVTVLLPIYNVNVFSSGFTTEDITAKNLQLGDIDIFSSGFITEDVTAERVDGSFPDRNIDVFSSGFTTESVTLDGLFADILYIDLIDVGYTTESITFNVLIDIPPFIDESGGIEVINAEGGNTSEWGWIYQVGGATYTAEMEAKLHGNYGFKHLFDGTAGRNDSGGLIEFTVETDVYARTYIRIDSNFTANADAYVPVFDVRSGGSHLTTVKFQLNGSGVPYRWQLSGGGAVSYDQTTFSMDEVHYIEARSKKGTGANSIHQVWIDGVLLFDVDNGSQTLDIDRLYVGVYEGSDISDGSFIYTDSIKIDTSRIGEYSRNAIVDNIVTTEDVTVSIPVGYEIDIFDEAFTSELVTAFLPVYNVNIYSEGFTSESVTTLIPEYHVNVFSSGFTTEDVTAVRIDVGEYYVNVFSSGFTTEDVTALIPEYHVNVFSEGFTTEDTIVENSQLGDIVINTDWGFTSEDITAVRIDVDEYNINVFDIGFITEVIIALIPIYNVDTYSEGFTTEAITAFLPLYNVNVFSEGFTTELVTTLIPIYNINIYSEGFTTEDITFFYQIYNIEISDDTKVTEFLNLTRVDQGVYVIDIYDNAKTTEAIIALIPFYHVDVYSEGFITEDITLEVPITPFIFDSIFTFEIIEAFLPYYNIYTQDLIDIIEYIKQLEVSYINSYDLVNTTEDIIVLIPEYYINIDLEWGNTTEFLNLTRIDPGAYVIDIYDNAKTIETITALIPIYHINVYSEGFITEDITLDILIEFSIIDDIFTTEDVTTLIPVYLINTYSEAFITETIEIENSQLGNINIDFEWAYSIEAITPLIPYYFIETYDDVAITEFLDLLRVDPGVFYINIFDGITAIEAINMLLPIYHINIDSEFGYTSEFLNLTRVDPGARVIDIYDTIFTIENLPLYLGITLDIYDEVFITEEIYTEWANFEIDIFESPIGYTNYIADGSFNTPKYWLLMPGWAISGGKLIATNLSIPATADEMSKKLKADIYYDISFDVANLTGGDLRIRDQYIINSNGPHNFIYHYIVEDLRFQFDSNSGSPSAEITNLYIIELPYQLEVISYIDVSDDSIVTESIKIEQPQFIFISDYVYMTEIVEVRSELYLGIFDNVLANEYIYGVIPGGKEMFTDLYINNKIRKAMKIPLMEVEASISVNKIVRKNIGL